MAVTRGCPRNNTAARSVPRRMSQKVLTLGVQDCKFRLQRPDLFMRRHGFDHRELPPQDIAHTTGFKWCDQRTRRITRTTSISGPSFPCWVSIQRTSKYRCPPFEGADYIADLNEPIDAALRPVGSTSCSTAGQLSMSFRSKIPLNCVRLQGGRKGIPV